MQSPVFVMSHKRFKLKRRKIRESTSRGSKYNSLIAFPRHSTPLAHTFAMSDNITTEQRKKKEGSSTWSKIYKRQKKKTEKETKKKIVKILSCVCVCHPSLPRISAKCLLLFSPLHEALYNLILHFIKYSLEFRKGFIIIVAAFKKRASERANERTNEIENVSYTSKMHLNEGFFDKRIKCGVMQFSAK